MDAKHSLAVEAAIKSAGDSLTAVHGPLLGLVRVLAEQMDSCGDEGPGSRLAASYLSALKDFGKVAGTGSAGVDAVDELKARRRRRALDG